MGPESTGKSILAKNLSEHFKGDLVEEYGREYTDDNPAKEMDVLDFELIAGNHALEIEDVIMNEDNQLVFIDTEAITTKLFGEMYLGNNFKSKYINVIINNQDFDLVLLCDIDVPWIDDGTRDFPHQRYEHFNKIRNYLDNNKTPYVVIRGDYKARFEQAKEEVIKIL